MDKLKETNGTIVTTRGMVPCLTELDSKTSTVNQLQIITRIYNMQMINIFFCSLLSFPPLSVTPLSYFIIHSSNMTYGVSTIVPSCFSMFSLETQITHFFLASGYLTLPLQGVNWTMDALKEFFCLAMDTQPLIKPSIS